MVEITRAKRAVLLLTVAAALLGLAAALSCVAFAVLNSGTIRAVDDLSTASLWVEFVATAAGLAAVSVVAWNAGISVGLRGAAELAAAAVATLLISIGALVSAVNAPLGSDGGSVVSAVGVGGWAILSLVTAARLSMGERDSRRPNAADLWLMPAGALLVLAVATGLPSPNGPGRGLPIAESVLFLLAFGGLAVTFRLAQLNGHIASQRITILEVGLAGLGLAYLVAAVADGFVFGPTFSLTADRIGLSLPRFLAAVAWAIVGLAAFQRFAYLTSTGASASRPLARTVEDAAPTAEPDEASAWPAPSPPPLSWQTGATGNVPSSTKACTHCGSPLPPDAAFCPSCGGAIPAPIA